MKKILLALIVTAFGVAGLKMVLAGDATVITRDVSIGNGQSGKNKPVSSGEYFLVFKAGEFQYKHKMLFLK